MTQKHINKRKKPEIDAEDEWAHITAQIGEKIDAADVMDVQDRTITFNDEGVRTKEEGYKKRSVDFKDGFGNTAQYLKFINAHLAEKKSRLDRLKQQNEKFEQEIAALKPDSKRTKDDLDNINYTEIKADDVRKVLKHIESERDAAKAKAEHFAAQVQKAQEELAAKNEQIEEISSELHQIEKKESEKSTKVPKEDDAIKVIQNELSSLASKNESEKIFGAINSLVVLLNSKNQDTLKELNSVKAEFEKMKNEYDKVMANYNQNNKK